MSSLFSAVGVLNEYATGGAANALNDWVITFPTKEFYVDTDENQGGGPKPFAEIWQNGTPLSCDTVSFIYYDREENIPGEAPGTLPPSPVPDVVVPTNALCFETQTLQFGSEALLGARNNRIVERVDDTQEELTWDSGWMELAFPFAGSIEGVEIDYATFTPTGNTATYNGLPVTGFSIKALTNNAERNGVILNYGTMSTHAYLRSITVAP